MNAAFLSDAHIKIRESDNCRKLIGFFNSLRGNVDRLFIVGDLFDFWFCKNGNVYQEFQTIIDALVALRTHGVAIYLFEGNHDFFLHEYFEDLGIKVFAEGATIDLDEKKIFVSHGDTVDTSDVPYLLLRRFLRSKIFYATQKCLPSSILWKVAQISSKMSREHLSRPPEGTIDIMRSFSMEKFRQDFDAVIFGHCHQPVIEYHEVNGTRKTFAILGDWINYFSYLSYQNGDFVLSSYEPNAP